MRVQSVLRLLTVASFAWGGGCNAAATGGDGGVDSGSEVGEGGEGSDAATVDAAGSDSGTPSNPDSGARPDSGTPSSHDSGSPPDSGAQRDSGSDGGGSSTCSGAAPATVTLPLPSNASGTWVSAANGGDLVDLPHPTSSLACSTCHLCGGGPNTLIGYDHSNTAFVCNYCHDPGTKVVDTSVMTGSMANYRSSSDSQVCTCCHNGTNNGAHMLPPGSPTPIVPSSPACTMTDAWPLIFPSYQPSTQTFSGGQFFGQ
jgi:hypothetical protein